MDNKIEKLRLTRIGEPQNKSGVSQKTGKPYNFNVVGFQAEGKNGWFNFNYNGEEHQLEVGQEYDFVLTSREYVSKDGIKKTAWNASFPKPIDQTVVDIEKLKNEIVGIKLRLLSVESKLSGKKEEDEPPFEEPNFDVPF